MIRLRGTHERCSNVSWIVLDSIDGSVCVPVTNMTDGNRTSCSDALSEAGGPGGGCFVEQDFDCYFAGLFVSVVWY
jgi:hypothetical protein